MIYVIDSSSLIVCGHYFPTRFPTFWQEFNSLAAAGRIVSVREVRRKLDLRASREHLRDWVNSNGHLFLPPSPNETQFVAVILSIQHFQQLIGEKQRLTGHPVADPFVVASAQVRDGCVVTEERILTVEFGRVPRPVGSCWCGADW